MSIPTDNSIFEFIANWGFCPHTNEQLCDDCAAHPSERSFSMEQASTLTHKTQVAIFNWCGCEDNEHALQWYNDCPMS